MKVTDAIPLENQTMGGITFQQTGKVQYLYPADLDLGVVGEETRSAKILIQPLLDNINADKKLGEGTISFNNTTRC